MRVVSGRETAVRGPSTRQLFKMCLCASSLFTSQVKERTHIVLISRSFTLSLACTHTHTRTHTHIPQFWGHPLELLCAAPAVNSFMCAQFFLFFIFFLQFPLDPLPFLSFSFSYTRSLGCLVKPRSEFIVWKRERENIRKTKLISRKTQGEGPLSFLSALPLPLIYAYFLI